MKIKNVYKLFGLMVLFVALQSRSNGPGNTANLQVTGAPGSSGNPGTCANAGCHAQGSFAPSSSVKLLDGTNEVTEYEPGKTYKLRISFTAGNGTPARYGFQAVALNGANSQAGAWGALGSGQQTVELNGRSYLEHGSPSQNSSFESEWIAPAIGTGNVTFYSAGIASNNNGNSLGDGTASSNLSVSEAPINNVADVNGPVARLQVLPNPVYEMMTLKINSRLAGDFKVRVMDVTGKEVLTSPINLHRGEQQAQIPVHELLAGLYVVQLYGEGHLAAVQMLKN